MSEQYHGQPGGYPYQANPYAQPPRGPAKPLEVAQALALTSAAIYALVFVADSLSFFAVSGEYREAAAAGDSAMEVWTWADLVVMAYIPALLFAYVANCVWLARARANTIALGSDPSAHQRSAVWSWLGWWVPIVSLWFPYQVVRDVWNESTAPRRDVLPLGWWWASWLVLLISGRVASQLWTGDEPLTDGAVDTMIFFQAVTLVSAVVGGALWILIIVRICAAQRERARSLGFDLR